MDSLYGQAGKDGLIGGIVTGDRLEGGTEDDRYLVFNNDTIVGFEAKDAKLLFRNSYLAAWGNEEMEAVDVGLQTMHYRTNNTRLLKDSLSTDPIVFEKVRTLPFSGSTRNVLNEFVTNAFNPKTGFFEPQIRYERVMQYSDWNESSAAENKVRETRTYFEFAKNWDSSKEIKAVVLAQQYLFDNFKLLSNWVDENPNDPLRYWISNDNQWWYRLDSVFANDFGRTNPIDDWATAWEVGLDDALSGQRSKLVFKLRTIDTLFQSLSAF